MSVTMNVFIPLLVVLFSLRINALMDPAVAGCFNFVSCYTDDSSSYVTRTLRYQVTNNALGGDTNQTVENCADICYTRGYSVMGLEYFSQCFCDTMIYSGATQAPFADCNTPCKGNDQQACGGPNRLSLYTLGNCPNNGAPAGNPTTTTVTTATVATTSTTTVAAAAGSAFPATAGYGFNYVGCYSDDPGSRTLRYQRSSAALGSDGNMTIENCANICQANKYMGLEYNYQCFCDDIIFNPAATSEPLTDCNTPCTGNPNEMCGGPSRLLLYVNSNNPGNTISTETTVTTISTPITNPATTQTVVTTNTVSASTDLASISRASAASVASAVSVASVASVSAASSRAAASSAAGAASASIQSLQRVVASFSSQVVTANSMIASLSSQVVAANVNNVRCTSFESVASVLSAASASQVRASASWASVASVISLHSASVASASSVSAISASRASVISVISVSLASVSMASASSASASVASASQASVLSASRVRASSSSASAASVRSVMSVSSASKASVMASSASVASVLSVATGNPFGYYRYVGCYHFGIVAPPLDTHILTPNLTLEACAHTCYSHTYMGVVMGTQCFCGNDLATSALSTDVCFGAEVNPCIGKSSQTCGGFTGMAVYGRVRLTGTCPAPKVIGSTVTVACSTVTGVR